MIQWQRFPVTYEYPVAFTREIFGPDNPLLAWTLGIREKTKRHRCIVFIDGGVAEACPTLPPAIERYFDAHGKHAALVTRPLLVDGGESIKSGFQHIQPIYHSLQTHNIDRHSYVIAVGGGAMLDTVGFAAATAHRGVRHVRVPTTVLSQNDSGVGVKNGLNLKGVKNYTGSFTPPWAVLNDFDLLATLPRRDRLAGISEAVKVALIRDPAFFLWLEANVDRLARFEPDAEEHMIRRSAELHMHQIAHGGDPFEAGSARPLDFGHWSAHKLESLTSYELHHGEAVAIGIALDTRYSVLAGLLEPGADERVMALLGKLGLRIWHPALARSDSTGRLELLGGLEEFREHLGGELTVTLLGALGTGVEVNEMDAALVAEAMRWLADREAG